MPRSDQAVIILSILFGDLGLLAMTGIYGVFPSPPSGLQYMLGFCGVIAGVIGIAWVAATTDPPLA